MSGHIKAIIFDLDGTLVDSVDGIQYSFNNAYKYIYKKENTKDIRGFIGPPISEILINIFSENDQIKIDDFVKYFKKDYDTKGFKKTKLYEGVKSVLIDLNSRGIKLFIATNKRLTPTKLILSYLEIYDNFVEIFCPDSHNNEFKKKEAMLSQILNSCGLNNIATIMVGDTCGDLEAAFENKISFIFVDYGYGKVENFDFKIGHLKELVKII